MNKAPYFSKTLYLLLFSILWTTHISGQNKPLSHNKLPNIVYILADDLGYGDVSCMNEKSAISTPNIDQLASEGMLFTDAHSGSSVCTPTRYGILTGRYAWRSQLEKGVTWSYDRHLIDPNRVTVADLLKQQNYETACVGKWHLGLDWGMNSASGIIDFFQPINYGPNEYGFDYFFGIAASLDIPPYLYIENDHITATEIDTIAASGGKAFWRESPIGNDFKMENVLPKLTEKAVEFIEEEAKSEHPFFLYFPLPAPHTPILPTRKFKGISKTNAYGDFVVMVDDVIRQIIAALEKSGESDNTLIIFTSDNGCSPMADFEELATFDHHPSYTFRGHKADIYEGGHRIPFIAKWPGKIKAGSRSNETICLTDFLATCSKITNTELADNIGEDSYDLSPILFQEKYTSPLRAATVHHSINGSFAIRQGKWKLNFCPGSGGWSSPTPKEAKELQLPYVQLYDLEKDIAEQTNLAETHPEIVKSLTKLMEKIVAEGRSTVGAAQSNDREVLVSSKR